MATSQINLPAGFKLEESPQVFNGLPEGFSIEKPKEQGYIESAAQGVSKGIGDVMFNAQGLVGKGLEKLGAEQVGQFLQRDAEQRKQQEAQTLAPYKEANPKTVAAGELVGDVVGTLPVGGVLAKGVMKAAPQATNLANALRTGGMAEGALGTRLAGGAVTGGVQSALIDPSVEGTLIGAGLGGGLAGALGKGVAKVAPQGVAAAREAGYVIPPTQAGGGALSRGLEALSGKAATSQEASVRNQAVTNALAAKSIGLAEDTPLTYEALQAVRNDAGKAYDAAASLPKVESVSAQPLMNIPASKGFDPKQAVYDLRVARNDADAYYKSYGRTADPEALTKAKAAKAKAQELEKSIDDYAVSINRPEIIPDLQEARKLIAKTHTIESALNPTSGNVNANKLAEALRKKRPLEAEQKQIAEFAGNFKTAVKTPENVGSNLGISPLDMMVAGGSGVGTALYNGDPQSAMYGALWPTSRLAARSAVLSKYAQNRLVPQTSQNALAEALRSGLVQMPAANASLATRRND